MGGGRKMCSRDSTSARNGQGLAVQPDIYARYGGMPPLGSRARCSAQFHPGSDHDLIIFVLSLISGQTLGGSHFSGSCSTPSPGVSDGAGASVDLRRIGELAVKLRLQRQVFVQLQRRAGGDERGVAWHRGAVDDETRAGKYLEGSRERGIADPIVRPGDTRAQQNGHAIDQLQMIEARAELAPRIVRSHGVVSEAKAAASQVCLAV